MLRMTVECLADYAVKVREEANNSCDDAPEARTIRFADSEVIERRPRDD